MSAAYKDGLLPSKLAVNMIVVIAVTREFPMPGINKSFSILFCSLVDWCIGLPGCFNFLFLSTTDRLQKQGGNPEL